MRSMYPRNRAWRRSESRTLVVGNFSKGVRTSCKQMISSFAYYSNSKRTNSKDFKSGQFDLFPVFFSCCKSIFKINHAFHCIFHVQEIIHNWLVNPPKNLHLFPVLSRVSKPVMRSIFFSL